MNLRGIDLNLLPVLEAIYVERSLLRASKTLHVTPPAVSNALARLRAHFDDALFVRAGRGVKPTSTTEALMPVVREALDRLRHGLEPKSRFDPATSSRLFQVSIRDAGAITLSAAIARTLEREAPHIHVHFSQVERPAIALELASGRLDLAIDVDELRGGELKRELLVRDPYVCALRPGHPLARARTKLTLERYLQARHIVVSSRRTGRGRVEDALRKLGHRLMPVMRLPHYLPAFRVVLATDHVLAAPASLLHGSELQARPLPLEVPELTLALYWRTPRHDHAEDPGLAWLRQVVKTAAAEREPPPR